MSKIIHGNNSTYRVSDKILYGSNNHVYGDNNVVHGSNNIIIGYNNIANGSNNETKLPKMIRRETIEYIVDGGLMYLTDIIKKNAKSWYTYLTKAVWESYKNTDTKDTKDTEDLDSPISPISPIKFTPEKKTKPRQNYQKNTTSKKVNLSNPPNKKLYPSIPKLSPNDPEIDQHPMYPVLQKPSAPPASVPQSQPKPAQHEKENNNKDEDIVPKEEKEDINPDGKEENLCTICIEREIKTVCLPCGHSKLCIHCARELMLKEKGNKSCPICQKTIDKIIRKY